MWYVNSLCVCVWVFGRMQTALPARGSAAKTIICDRSARVVSSLRDSLTLSDDQNRKETNRKENESERDTQTKRWSAFLTVRKCKKNSEYSIKLKDVKSVSLSKSQQVLIVIFTLAFLHTDKRFVSQVIIRMAASQSGFMDFHFVQTLVAEMCLFSEQLNLAVLLAPEKLT